MIKASMAVRMADGSVELTSIEVNSHRAVNERERQVDLRVRIMHAVGEALRLHPDCETIDVRIQNRPPALRVVADNQVMEKYREP